jgi:tetratricopeptide (TPR) repeat protein
MFYIIAIIIILFFFSIIIYLKFFQINRRLLKAKELMAAEAYDAAGEIIRSILDSEKDNIEARYLRVKLLFRQKQYVLAISELNTVLTSIHFENFVDPLEAYYLLAELNNLTQNWKKEIDAYKMVLTYNPDDTQANYRIGKSYFVHKQYNEAKVPLGKALELNPNLSDIYHDFGVCSFLSGELDVAEAYLLKSLDYIGNHVEGRFYLGNIYVKKNDLEKAIPMLEAAKTSHEFGLKAGYKLGQIYFNQQDYYKAVDEMDEGIRFLKENDDESYAYRYLLAECFEHLNKIDEAIHHWEKITAGNPGYRNVRQKLENYHNVVKNENTAYLFNNSIEEIQPAITEMIGTLNYSIIKKENRNENEYFYKAYNVKRINDSPILIYFNRVAREITEGEIIFFAKLMTSEKCSNGIYISTSKFSLRAKSTAASRSIEVYGIDFVNKVMEKYLSKHAQMMKSKVK